MKLDFKNQIVLITGATRGIGKQLAQDFENLGAGLILTGTKSEQIKELNALVNKNKKTNIKYYCVDFSDEKATTNFILELKKYNKIDVCVNNAGINRIDYIYDASLKDWNDIINVNLRAPFVITKAVAQLMRRNRYGKIINISSIFGVIGKEKRSIYSSSKSGLLGLTKACALDLAPYNILVNSVSPGFVLTDLTQSILTQGQIKELKSKIPLGRFANPAEISNCVLFLASKLNRYITGQNIIVDGGYVSI